ncbi:MAG: nuclear transport factor 2 family protein [Verrucomicrobiae bacterium]|nr:nuclear transport factor 2 family protein [Verrucomicrobiae bacterium]
MKRYFQRSIPFLLGMVVSPLLLLLAAAGCASVSAPDESPIEEYNEATRRSADPSRGVPATDSEARQGLKAWKSLMADLSAENIRGRASLVYADALFFNDTLKTLHTGAEVEAYLLETAEMLENGSVEFRDEVWSEDGSVYVRWEMVYRGEKLAGGEPIRTIGMSQLRFDEEGRVVLHQDFWDSTRGLFENLPVIGGPLKGIKDRL